MNPRNHGRAEALVVARTAPTVPDPTGSGNLSIFLYLLFVVSWFLHFGERFPILGTIRFDLILVVGIACLSFLGAADRDSVEAESRIRPYLVVLAAYAILTIPFVEWPGSVVKSGLEKFVKAAVFYYFTAKLVKNKRSLAWLVGTFVACQAFRVLEPVYLHVTEGYWGSFASMANWEHMDRLAGAPLDVINPNGLAFVVVTVIVFCHYLCPLTKLGGMAYLALLPVSLYALMLSASRTGILALGVVMASIWWKSRHKMSFLVVAAVVAFVAVPLFSDNLQDRYLSIFSDDTKNAATANERADGLRAGLAVALRRPLFGHGLGTSREANANFGGANQLSHNLYVETAQEIGLLGLLILVGFLVSVARDLTDAARRSRAKDGEKGLLPRLTNALQVWLAMNLLFSFASYGLSSYEWYLLAGLSEVVNRLAVTAPGLALTEAVQTQSSQLRRLQVGPAA